MICQLFLFQWKCTTEPRELGVKLGSQPVSDPTLSPSTECHTLPFRSTSQLPCLCFCLALLPHHICSPCLLLPSLRNSPLPSSFNHKGHSLSNFPKVFYVSIYHLPSFFLLNVSWGHVPYHTVEKSENDESVFSYPLVPSCALTWTHEQHILNSF